jgi:glycosyltransferase involved in cell wall biosynthesis
MADLSSRVTVVIPSFNRQHILTHTIPYYLALGLPLLVIDDGSTDETTPWLKQLGIHVVRHDVRRGLPAARNTGLNNAQTPWVWFGEDDVIMPANHVETLHSQAVALGPDIGAVAGALFSGSDWTLPPARPVGTGPHIDRTYLLIDFSAAAGLIIPLPTLHGCSLVHRQRMLDAGGFDPAYTNGSFREESEGHARLWTAGYRCLLVTDAWAIHVRHRLGGGCRGGQSIWSKIFNRWSYWRNDLRYLIRHHQLWRRMHTRPAPMPWVATASAARIAWHALKATFVR